MIPLDRISTFILTLNPIAESNRGQIFFSNAFTMRELRSLCVSVVLLAVLALGLALLFCHFFLFVRYFLLHSCFSFVFFGKRCVLQRVLWRRRTIGRKHYS